MKRQLERVCVPAAARIGERHGASKKADKRQLRILRTGVYEGFHAETSADLPAAGRNRHGVRPQAGQSKQPRSPACVGRKRRLLARPRNAGLRHLAGPRPLSASHLAGMLRPPEPVLYRRLVRGGGILHEDEHRPDTSARRRDRPLLRFRHYLGDARERSSRPRGQADHFPSNRLDG